MREVLFRGFHICETGKDKIFLNGEWIQGEWVEGSLLIDPDLEYYNIIGFNYYSSENGLEREEFTEDVIPETVGQYTGLTDKNGTKIFEGDIVISCTEEGNAIIKWEEDTARFIIEWESFVCDFDNCYGYELEVAGNTIAIQNCWRLTNEKE